MPVRPLIHVRRLLAGWYAWILILGGLLTLLFAYLGGLAAGPFQRLDHAFLDAWQRAQATARPAAHVVVVNIDDVSLSALGQWPWPRYRLAALLEAVAAGEPAALGLDVILPEPDQTSLAHIRQTFRRDFGLDLKIAGVPDGLTDNDGYLGFVLGRLGVVGARYFFFDHLNREAVSPSVSFAFEGLPAGLPLPVAPGVLLNTAAIESQLKYSGFMNAQADPDGIWRHQAMLIGYQGRLYPHLALASFMRAEGIQQARFEMQGLGPVLQLGAWQIPLSPAGHAMPMLKGAPDRFVDVSAADVLSGKVDPAVFAGKIVFVGSSAAGLNDFHQTVFDAQFPGLKLLAATVEAIYDGAFIREPVGRSGVILLACLLAGGLMTLGFVRRSTPLRLALSALCVMGLFPLMSWLALSLAGVFISPVTPVLLALSLLLFYALAGYALAQRKAYLSLKQIANARQVTMESMAAVAETRDPETGGHIKRTQWYVKIIARRLQQMGYAADVLTDEYIDLLFASAPLHDIGKVGVPDRILLKPGKLTDEEFALMKQHTAYGLAVIRHSSENIEGDNFLSIAGEIAIAHHEKWDGTGYPNGLTGTAIPLSARIMAVADVYDALISRRCYKPPMQHEHAETYLLNGRGTHFDPQVVDAFVAERAAVIAIAKQYRDDDLEMYANDIFPF